MIAIIFSPTKENDKNIYLCKLKVLNNDDAL